MKKRKTETVVDAEEEKGDVPRGGGLRMGLTKRRRVGWGCKREGYVRSFSYVSLSVYLRVGVHSSI